MAKRKADEVLEIVPEEVPEPVEQLMNMAVQVVSPVVERSAAVPEPDHMKRKMEFARLIASTVGLQIPPDVTDARSMMAVQLHFRSGNIAHPPTPLIVLNNQIVNLLKRGMTPAGFQELMVPEEPRILARELGMMRGQNVPNTRKLPEVGGYKIGIVNAPGEWEVLPAMPGHVQIRIPTLPPIIMRQCRFHVQKLLFISKHGGQSPRTSFALVPGCYDVGHVFYVQFTSPQNDTSNQGLLKNDTGERASPQNDTPAGRMIVVLDRKRLPGSYVAMEMSRLNMLRLHEAMLKVEAMIHPADACTDLHPESALAAYMFAKIGGKNGILIQQDTNRATISFLSLEHMKAIHARSEMTLDRHTISLSGTRVVMKDPSGEVCFEFDRAIVVGLYGQILRDYPNTEQYPWKTSM